jgi:uncharacterized protein
MEIKIVDKWALFEISLLIYLFVSIIPVVLYLKFHDKVRPIEFLKINNDIKKNILKGLLISTAFIIVLIIKNIIFGWKVINFNIGLLWISGLLVGLFEEIPVRGFIFQKLLLRRSFIFANLSTTILFIILHIPIWLINNVNIIDSIKSMFLVSLVLGYLFKEYKSLWIPIICHSIFNLCIWVGLG